MNGSEWPEMAKLLMGRLFVLAEATCLESRRPLLALRPAPARVPGATCHGAATGARASGPGRAGGQERSHGW